MNRSTQIDAINKQIYQLLGKPVRGSLTADRAERWIGQYDLSMVLYGLYVTAKRLKESHVALTRQHLLEAANTELGLLYARYGTQTLYGIFKSRNKSHEQTQLLPSSERKQEPTNNSARANKAMEPKDTLLLQVKKAKPNNQDLAVAGKCSQIIHYNPQTVAKIVHVCLSAGYKPEDVICAIYIYRNNMRYNARRGHTITAPAKYILGVVRQLVPGDAQNIIYQLRLQAKRRQVPKSIWRGMQDKRSGDYDDLIYFYGWGECYHAFQYHHQTPPLTLTGKIYLYDKQAVFNYEPVDKATQLRVAVLLRNALVQSLHSHRITDLVKLDSQAIQHVVPVTRQQCAKKSFHRDLSGHTMTIGVDLGPLQKSDVHTAVHYAQVTAKKLKKAKANPENLSYPSIKKYEAFATDKSVPETQRVFNQFVVGSLRNLHRDYQNAKEISDDSRPTVFLQGDLCGRVYRTLMQFHYLGLTQKQIIRGFQKVIPRVHNPYDVLPTLKGLLLE